MPLDHYVSQVHLRNFYSSKLGNRMYATRKSDLKSFQPGAKAVCGINDGSTNAYLREDRAIEEFLNTVEPRYEASVEKLRNDKIDAECIYAISGFVAFVASCAPASMRISSEPVKNAVEAFATLIEARGQITPPPAELGGKTLTALLEEGVVKIRVDPKFPQALGISSILSRVALFGNFAWDVILNDWHESPFFTSDFPVAIEETNDPRLINRIVPLAPNIAIRIRPNLTLDRKQANFSFESFSHRVRRAGYDEVVQINRLIVQCAEETVFYCDDLSWIDRFIARNRSYRIEPTTQNLKTAKGVLLVSTQKISPYEPPS